MAATIGDEFVHDQPFSQEDTISPALFCCIFQAIKNHLTPSSLNQLRLRLETMLEQLSPNEPARPFIQSLLAQVQQL